MYIKIYMKHKFDFQTQHTIEKRRAESARIIKHYPDRIPIIVEVHAKDRQTLNIGDKKKFLVPNSMTVGEFNYVLYRRLKNKDANKALFMFTENKTLASTEQMLTNVYKTNKNEDGFLYFVVTGEETFGAY